MKTREAAIWKRKVLRELVVEKSVDAFICFEENFKLFHVLARILGNWREECLCFGKYIPLRTSFVSGIIKYPVMNSALACLMFLRLSDRY